MSKEHRPYLVKRRIRDGRNLWGITADVDGEDQRIPVDQLLGLIKNGYKFIVDLRTADRPALLIAVHQLTRTGGIYYFKTIGDSSKKNNFSAVPEVQLITAKTKTKSCKLK